MSGRESVSSFRGSSLGFTLIELLVVLAIIAVIVSILLPSLQLARSSARESVCAGSIRQLSVANALYADDSRDRYAPGAPNFIENRTRWHGTRPAPSGPFRAVGGPLNGYIDSGEAAGNANLPSAARVCPSFVSTLESLTEHGIGFERSSGGYGYNNAYVGSHRRRSGHGASTSWLLASDRVGSARSAFASPAATIEFADAAFASGESSFGVIEYSFVEPRFWPDFPASDPSPRADPSIHFRHGASARVNGRHSLTSTVFLDGHVGRFRMSDTWSSGVYGVDPSDVQIGWFSTQTEGRTSGPPPASSIDGNDLFDFD